MTNLLIHNVDPDPQRRLEESAQKHGRSLSDEAKALLLEALPTKPIGASSGP